MAPVPANLATPIERQLAKAIGITGKQVVPRLPRDVEKCNLGGRCCWRWLARAALEEVCGTCTTHLTLAETVGSIRDELKELRGERGLADKEHCRAMQAEAELCVLRESHRIAMNEVKEFRAVERETGRLQVEIVEVRSANGRLEATIEAQSSKIAKLQTQHHALLEVETADLRARAERAEQELMKANVLQEDLQRRLAEAEQRIRQLKDPSTPRSKAKPKISPDEARRRRAARRAQLTKLARKKASQIRR